MEKRIILVGAGGLAREILSFFDFVDVFGDLLRIDFYIDDTGPSLEKFDYKINYLGPVSDFIPNSEDYFIMAVADPNIKHNLFDKLVNFHERFLKIIHPTAIVAKTSRIGCGSVIFPYAVISADSEIGNFVNINSMSSVGHDAFVGNFSTLSAHVDITGGVRVGADVFFGTSACVIPRLKIGDGAKIGAGATVMRSIKDGQTVYTMPAKRL
ncbi:MULTISPECIES: acetyltransferase [Comamonas]|uniref:acetyltransferase n=1 Tax=Comamonas thiooxydans TaxID=363952 RepID=UPI00211452CD|nr:acetyltransferase [Comamonas thiooxydans]UUE92261.1 acetyltransferase [Comamonas thiooxydans]